MTEYIANIKYLKGSSRKARIPAKIVIGMKADEAIATLKFVNKEAASDVTDAIKSAVANARNNFNVTSELVVKGIMVDTAPRVKRSRAGSKGNSVRYVKHRKHIKVVLSDLLEK